MTKEEFNTRYNELEAEFDNKIRELKRNFIFANARFKKGDKIKNGDISIVVEGIRGSCLGSRVPTIYYIGTMLTKAGKSRKDCQVASVYDEGAVELI